MKGTEKIIYKFKDRMIKSMQPEKMRDNRLEKKRTESWKERRKNVGFKKYSNFIMSLNFWQKMSQ